MSAEHRKPIVAFVVLALAAVALVGVQRAEAQHGVLLAAGIGVEVRAQGELPPEPAAPAPVVPRAGTLRPVFPVFPVLPAGDGHGPLEKTLTPAPAVPRSAAPSQARPASAGGPGAGNDGTAAARLRPHNDPAPDVADPPGTAADHPSVAGARAVKARGVERVRGATRPRAHTVNPQGRATRTHRPDSRPAHAKGRGGRAGNGTSAEPRRRGVPRTHLRAVGRRR